MDGKIWTEFPILSQGNHTRDAVMPVCVDKEEIERQIHMKHIVITRKHINTVTIEPLLLAAVPAPSGMGIGIAPVTFTAPDAFFPAFAVLDAKVAGGNWKTGAVTSGSNRSGMNEFKCNRRNNGGVNEDFLKKYFRALIERASTEKEISHFFA